MITVVGLGNPGDEYIKTRHNAGRIILQTLAADNGFSAWKRDGKSQAILAKGDLSGVDTQFLLPDNFMNNSGTSVAYYLKTPEDVSTLVVVYDDMDLPLGKIRISFDRGTGGHNGIDSIQQCLGTREFVRVRVGVSPVSEDGMRKPKGEQAVLDFLLKNFKKDELAELSGPIAEKVAAALIAFAKEGKDRAMTAHNG
jgi:PTH1 family peptidyl-tRNA hydrolase